MMINFMWTYRVYLFIFLSLLLLTNCKRKREIDIEGRVTDKYTGKPIPNLRINLYSSINNDEAYDRSYFVNSNSDGTYFFSNAYFSKPNFSGILRVWDENGIYSSTSSEGINKKDAKWFGKTKLIRDLKTICFAKINLSASVNVSYNWYSMKVMQKFIGTRSIDELSDFGQSTWILKYYTTPVENSMIGYSDGITILRTELFDISSNLLKIQFDTIRSGGCGTTNNFTVTVN